MFGSAHTKSKRDLVIAVSSALDGSEVQLRFCQPAAGINWLAQRKASMLKWSFVCVLRSWS